jgi:hypothetical protein
MDEEEEPSIFEDSFLSLKIHENFGGFSQQCGA